MVTYLSYFRDLARAKLLKWIRRMLPQFDITNFLTDWMDGRAFAALTNKCFPGTLPDSASVEKENPLENVQMVLDTIDVQLGIPTNFTAKKLLMSGVEELQVMTLIMRIRNGKLQPVANKVIVSGPGINEAVVGKETQFTVNTAQAGPGKLSVKATYEDDQTVDCHVREKGKIATVTYRPKVPGKIAIDIRWFDVPVPQSPFIVTATDSLMIKFTGFDDHRRVVHVNEPIQISLNTEKAGQGMLTAHLKYNSDAPIPARVTKRSNSTTKMTYTPPKSGEAVLHVIWNGKEMTHLTVTYTVVDSASYQVSTRPEDREYMVNEKVRFIVTTKEAPLNILQMKAVMQGDDGGLNVPICFDTIEGNQGRATFRPTMHGTYRIEVTCIDKVVQGSPFHVNIVDPTQCKIVGDIPKYLQLNVPYTFDVEVKHAGKGMLKCEYEENQRSADAFETNISPPDKSGISKVRLTPQCNGDFLVTFKSQGTDIPGCPFRVLVCDPLSCHVTGVALEKRSAKLGKLIRLKVAFDPVEDLKPSIKVTGPSAKYTPEITETEEDTYTVQFTPWEVGTHEISITYGDFQVPKSPFRVAVISFDSSICSATGSGLQKAFTGIPAQFVVLAKEEGLLKDGTLQIAVKGVVNNTRCKVKARDSKNGKYNVAYVVHDPGSYLISILASGKPIAGSPFRLTALPGPMANKCLMYGPILQPNAVLTIGKPMDFAVDTSAAGVGNLSVKAIGPGDTQARVYLAKSSEKKGVHNVKLDPIRHGRYRVSVKWSDEHIPGSPFMLSIYPGADASKCKAYGPGLEDGLVGKPSSFTIETRDAGAGTLKVRLHGVKGAFKTDIKPIDQHNIRTLQANYNPKREGDYLVSIQWSDRHVPGSPFRVKIAGNGTTINDESLKAIAQDEVKDSIAEELDDANWGDEEEGTTVTQSEPVLQKRKKKLKKHRKTSDSNEGDIIPSNTTTTTPIPSDTKLPSFRSTSMNYREAFVRGGSGRQQVAKKMSKGTRGKRSKK